MDGSERLGYSVFNIVTGENAIMAHKNIDSRLRVLGYGIDTEALKKISIPAIEYARDECEVWLLMKLENLQLKARLCQHSQKRS